MVINLLECDKTNIFETCHCKNKNNCLEICKNFSCYDGDKIGKAFKKNKASFDCIILNNNKYLFVDFKDISVFYGKNKDHNILENIKKKYEGSKTTFDFEELEDVVVVFVDEDVQNKISIKNYMLSYINKNNPLKLKDRSQKVKYKFCKSEKEELSFEFYLNRYKK